MKKIEAIIRTTKLEEVKRALHLHGVDGMTITETVGLGPTVAYRGVETPQTLTARLKLEVFVENDHADEAVDAIYRAAHTGEVGDGRIVVSDLECIVKIRTGETQLACHHVSH
ncbi:P-II family nitrogen regulator [Lacipirellula limnantheis]|uniref:Nitrogen regulatory protein P-II n=1 Tax=Lacipirellula limnantheis TaxID=2528024 RepID=A0A517TUK5_9BACT|nr:P-II family nitrogen regulator [Lacipirellula limnantheis]QDT72047.1 Nitrogen regulatory protein P-II [Lacipirellula limnantheis]